MPRWVIQLKWSLLRNSYLYFLIFCISCIITRRTFHAQCSAEIFRYWFPPEHGHTCQFSASSWIPTCRWPVGWGWGQPEQPWDRPWPWRDQACGFRQDRQRTTTRRSGRNPCELASHHQTKTRSGKFLKVPWKNVCWTLLWLYTILSVHNCQIYTLPRNISIKIDDFTSPGLILNGSTENIDANCLFILKKIKRSPVPTRLIPHA